MEMQINLGDLSLNIYCQVRTLYLIQIHFKILLTPLLNFKKTSRRYPIEEQQFDYEKLIGVQL